MKKQSTIIDWNKLTSEDSNYIHKIADRALNLAGLSGIERGMSGIALEMTLGAVHTICPLDWERFLTAKTPDFVHDIDGISRYYRPLTGKLENCFVPRFARREAAVDG